MTINAHFSFTFEALRRGESNMSSDQGHRIQRLLKPSERHMYRRIRQVCYVYTHSYLHGLHQMSHSALSAR
jgi:hypothetical protein